MKNVMITAAVLLGFGVELAFAQGLEEATPADVMRLEAQVEELEAKVAELESAAEPEAEEVKGPWSAEVSLGYLASKGNTDSSSSTFAFRAGYDKDRWHHMLGGKAFGSSEDNDTTAENYKLGWKSSFDFSEFNYGFGSLDWNSNRFSGYPKQSFAVVGYGRRVINSETLILNLEAGVGYAKQKKVTDVDLDLTENENGGVGRLSGDFTWNFSDNGAFDQVLRVSAASANTYWESISKVRANLVGQLALGLSYTIQSNSDVAPGVDKTDTFTAITLDYVY